MALISGLIGAFLGIVGKYLSKVLDNWWEIHKMRRVLYGELITMFQRVEDIMSFTEPEQDQQLKAFLKFKGEAYWNARQDVYMQLSERIAVESLYPVYHRILDDNQSRPLTSEAAKRMLAHFVEKNELQRKYIEKFLGRAKAKALLDDLHAIYEKSKFARLSETSEPIDGK